MAEDKKAASAQKADAEDKKAASAFDPKVGQMVQITEVDKKHAGQEIVSVLLITAVGETTAAKIDEKTKKVVTEDKEFPTGKGKVTRTVAVLETIKTYDGVLFSAQRQLPEPRRGVLAAVLSPLEA